MGGGKPEGSAKIEETTTDKNGAKASSIGSGRRSAAAGMEQSMGTDACREETERKPVSVRTIYSITITGMIVTMAAVCIFLYGVTGDVMIPIAGILLAACALVWIMAFMGLMSRRLSMFTADICQVLDRMINGDTDLIWVDDSETLFARISNHLVRLYEILRENRQQAAEERQKIQALVSDISHQIKTPVSNLKMVTDTLLTKPVTEEEREEFIQGISAETDKLDFLFQALLKTSRLESGAICLAKTDGAIYDTLAQAVSGIVYNAEKKKINVTVQCPEQLHVLHDRKWTAEALFNLLDNAVKYTAEGGSITVSVEQWEMYVKIDISDTGKGIAESRQASVFRRFYREEEVHDEQGVGIGLYLTREIITRQGGYVKLASEIGKGSTFSVFLPWR